MNSRIILMLVAIGLAAGTTKPSLLSNAKDMKLNAGIITSNLQQTKSFYTTLLGFTVVFENEWYILLQSPGGTDQLSFLLPGQEHQQPLFREEFNGKGVYLTIEVDNVDEVYQQLQARGVKMAVSLRNEPWGDRHFAIVDPNGIGVDIVTYQSPG